LSFTAIVAGHFRAPGFYGSEEQYGSLLLCDGSEVAGGRSYTVDNLNELGDIAEKIGMELVTNPCSAIVPPRAMQ
jgi:hypothetical protein